MFKIKHNRGFTLIELLVVIAVIGLLASIVLVAVNSARTKSRDAKRLSDMKQVQLALEIYYDNNDGYPEVSGTGSWADVWARLQTELETVGIMSGVPQDPSGGSNTYYYFHCNSGQSYRLLAFLETSHSALDNDIDGNFYLTDSRCEDANSGYCIGTPTWCW